MTVVNLHPSARPDGCELIGVDISNRADAVGHFQGSVREHQPVLVTSRAVLESIMFWKLVFNTLKSRRLRVSVRELSRLSQKKKIQYLICVILFLYVVYSCSHDNQTSNVTDMDVGGSHPSTKAPEEKKPELPPPGAAEEEHHSSLTIFFILLVVGKYFSFNMYIVCVIFMQIL